MELILGGRGSGKTYRLVQMTGSRLRAGKRAVLVVPTEVMAVHIRRSYSLDDGAVQFLAQFTTQRGFAYDHVFVDQFDHMFRQLLHASPDALTMDWPANVVHLTYPRADAKAVPFNDVGKRDDEIRQARAGAIADAFFNEFPDPRSLRGVGQREQLMLLAQIAAKAVEQIH